MSEDLSLAGTKYAKLCIGKMKELKCDPLLLFWLRHEAILDKTRLGCDLTTFTRSMKVSPELLGDPIFFSDFFRELRVEANHGMQFIPVAS